MAAPTSLKIKLQILCGDEIAMGPGKADLLEAIAVYGSISAAARAMGMSYRRAWLLVDVMNRCWNGPLVEAVAGGSQERGARLTPFGTEVLKRYRNLQTTLIEGASSGFADSLQSLLASSPRPSQH